MERNSPKCIKCKHYFSTFNQYSPHGCRAYRFQGKSIPSMVIKRETGEDCLSYQIKDIIKKKEKNQKKELDLNDPKLW